MKLNILLRKKRREKDISQEEFANMVGCRKGAISAWERGTQIPNGGALLRALRILDIKLEDIDCRCEACDK